MQSSAISRLKPKMRRGLRLSGDGADRRNLRFGSGADSCTAAPSSLTYHTADTNGMLCAAVILVADFRKGSVSTELGSPLYFRSSPMNGHSQGPPACLKGANTGHRATGVRMQIRYCLY